MDDTIVDFLLKGVQQLGVPTISLLIFLLIVYRVSVKLIVPTTERLVEGHLQFLADLKEIMQEQSASLNHNNRLQIEHQAVKLDRLDHLKMTLNDTNIKVTRIHNRIINESEDD